MGTCLLIGDIGLLSNNLAEQLVINDFNVIIFNGKAVHSGNPSLHYFNGDLSNGSDLAKAFEKGIDIVIYLSLSVCNGEFEVIKDVTEQCITHNVPRLLCVGTLGSELNVEKIRSVAENSNLRVSFFHTGNIYGEVEDLDNCDGCLVSCSTMSILNNEPINVCVQGDTQSDFVYVGDVMDALITAVDTESCLDKDFWIGSGKIRTIDEVLDIILSHFSRDRFNYPIVYGSGSYVNVQEVSEETEKKLNWKPKTSFEEGIRKAIDNVVGIKLDELGYEQNWIMRLGAAKRNHCSIRGRKHIEDLDADYNPQADTRPPFTILDYESCNSQFLKCRKFDIIVDTIKKLGCSGSYLDIGCETGALIQRLSRRFEKLNGVDVNIKAIEYARDKTKNLENVSFKINDGTNLEFSDKSFNCVSCLDAIEHITEPELLVSEVHRVLEDNGTFIMSVPNWFDAVKRFLTNIETKHVSGYTPFGWKRMLKNKGFKIIEYRAADFPILSFPFLAKNFPWLGMCIIIVARKCN